MNLIVAKFLVFLVIAFGSPINGYEIEKFITGGDAARSGQFPFQVGVRTQTLSKNGNLYNSWCGGSLISDEWVITAAHCLIGGVSAEIYLGATDLSKDEPGRIIVKVTKENMFIHENYIRAWIRNDIGLVKLPQRVQLNEYIQTVNLPRRSHMNETFIKQVGWISGWGDLGDDKGSSNQLQYTRRWILPHDYCKHDHGDYYVPETQICVDGSHGISSCRGDSGGPLTVEEEDGSRTLIGTTSYGEVYCEKGAASVYTRITAFLDWVVEKTGMKLRD